MHKAPWLSIVCEPVIKIHGDFGYLLTEYTKFSARHSSNDQVRLRTSLGVEKFFVFLDPFGIHP